MLEMPERLTGTAGRSMAGLFAAAWGVAGFTGLLVFAIVRLTAMAQGGFALPWHPQHWLALVASVAGMAYFEGYRAFQCAYAPRFAARVASLLVEATALRVLLAPAYCMSFFAAPRQRIVASWAVTIAIVALVLAVRLLPQPWRGILDAGVVVGLSWGLAATLLACRGSFSGQPLTDASTSA